MLVKLAERYGDPNIMEEYQVQELRKKIMTITSTPAVRQAWNTFKTNPNYTEIMYWENLIQNGSFFYFRDNFNIFHLTK